MKMFFDNFSKKNNKKYKFNNNINFSNNNFKSFHIENNNNIFPNEKFLNKSTIITENKKNKIFFKLFQKLFDLLFTYLKNILQHDLYKNIKNFFLKTYKKEIFNISNGNIQIKPSFNSSICIELLEDVNNIN